MSPFDFENHDWFALWAEPKSVFEFWIRQGVKTFRVDNPHTKPFRLWEWCLGTLTCDSLGLVFLAEVFTLPNMMYYLAKIGFNQSYNYFPWRNTSPELQTYQTKLT